LVRIVSSIRKRRAQLQGGVCIDEPGGKKKNGRESLISLGKTYSSFKESQSSGNGPDPKGRKNEKPKMKKKKSLYRKVVRGEDVQSWKKVRVMRGPSIVEGKGTLPFRKKISSGGIGTA